MTEKEAYEEVESFIGRFRLRMSQGTGVAFIEMADVVEALVVLIEHRKHK